jgi:hypothetical protein
VLAGIAIGLSLRAHLAAELFGRRCRPGLPGLVRHGRPRL